ncbi:MAG TPA: efflux RND transporter periplasmic adaptor subunit [Pirellulales bacterium]|nr:efflux RND transporter periplasmic adaptor subunit [Pirellulales bacterium]
MPDNSLQACPAAKPRNGRFDPVVFLAVCAAMSAVGCGKRNAYVPPPPPAVVVATAEVHNETLYHEFPGTTEASQTVSIVPRVLGYIDSIHFTDGSTVAKDQLLFVIDPRPYQDAYDVAVAQVNVAQAAFDEAKANYARGLEVAKTPGAISKQQLDTYKAAAEQGEANLKLAQANAANAKLNLDFTHITAPIRGKIGRRLVDIGNLVTANITQLTTIDQYDPMYAYFNVSEADFLAYLKRERHDTGAGQPASPESNPPTAMPGSNAASRAPSQQSSSQQPTSQQPAANDAQPPAAAPNTASGTSGPATAKKNVISTAKPDQSSHIEPSAQTEKHAVEMGLSDETGYPHKGTIDFADNQVNPATGTLLLRGVFSDPPPYVLAPGLFVRIRVPIGVEPNALLVPDRALGTDQQGKYLLLVRSDHVVEHRAVKTGALVDGDMRIIDSGLKPGEQVIVEGLQFARPGSKVNPVSQAEADAQSQQTPASGASPPATNAPQK